MSELPEDINQDSTAQFASSDFDGDQDPLGDIPDQIGPYRILELIGQGGMGEVLRAEQREPIRRDVALKLIKRGMDSKLVLARFEAERQALALMDHPHIAKVFDAGVDPTGRPFFVMEYVRGKPITEYADLNHLSIEERLDLFRQVCHAIQHAHQKGIIHRDIKPSNILVSTQDGKPFAKVIDFGVAKATAQQLTERTLYTLHNQFVGTPQYMSPEQAEGSADIDTRSDVYSLGVLLYELLTGSTPFGGEKQRKAAFEQIKKMICENDPQKPSTRLSTSGASLSTLAAARRVEPQRLGALVRGELDWIVMTALEKDRRRRYDSPNSMSEDVERYLKGEAIEAAPPSTFYRLQKLYRRHRVPVTAAAALIAVLAISTTAISALALKLREQVGIVTELADKEKGQRIAAEQARQKAELQSYINSFAAAQSAIASENWPEARIRLQKSPDELRGWEWDFLSAEASAPLFALAEQAHDCQITADGRYLLVQHMPRLSRSAFGKVSLVDVESRKPIATYMVKGYRSRDDQQWYSYSEPAISDGGHVAIHSDDYITVYHRSEKIRKIELIERDRSTPSEVKLQFSPGGTLLAVIRGSDVYFYATVDGSIVGKLTAPLRQPIAITDDDRYVCVETSRRDLALHLASGAEIRRFSPQPTDDEITGKSFAPDGKTLAVGYETGLVILLDVSSGRIEQQLSADPLPIVSLQFSNDGKHLLTKSESKVSVWELQRGRAMATLRKSSESPRFSQDDTRIIGFQDGTIWNWRLGDSPAAQPRPTLDATIRDYSDDAALAASIDNGRVRLWDTSQRSLHPTALYRPQMITSPNDLLMEVAGLKLSIDHWGGAMADAAAAEAESGGSIRYRTKDAEHPNGLWKATADQNSQVVVRDSGNEVLATFGDKGFAITSMAVSPSGNRLITSGRDGAVRFWDTQEWTEIATLRFGSAISGLGLSSDGTRLIVQRADGSLFVLDTRSGDVREAADQKRAMERKAAQQVARDLLNRETDWTNVAQQVMGDDALHPMQRLAILDELHQQVQNARGSIEDRFTQLKRDWGLKTAVFRQLSSEADSPVQRAHLAKLLVDWQQSDPDEIQSACINICEKQESSKFLVQEAHAAMKAIVEESPRIGFRNTLAGLEYRIGNYDTTVEQLTTGNSWLTNEEKVYYWNAHTFNTAMLAMAHEQLGNREDALKHLRTALCFWDARQVEEWTPLQREAARFICPQAVTREAPQPSAEFAEMQAQDVSDISGTRSKLGEVGRFKGWVARVVPSYRGTSAFLILHPSRDAPMVMAFLEAGGELNWTFFKDLEGREVVITGELANVPPRHAIGWKAGRMQIEIFDRDDIEVIEAAPPVPRWWEQETTPKEITEDKD